MGRVRLLRLMAMVVAVVLLAAACGGANEDESASNAGKSEGAPPPAPTGAESPAAQLRSELTGLLEEHVVLTTAATGAALDGRQEEYDGGAAGLDANSEALTQSIGAAMGQQTADGFRPLWKKHIGFVVDYVTGLASSDKAKQDKAVADLLAYTQEFGTFLNSVLPTLPVATVADLVKRHILSLKEVIDARAARDAAKAFTALRTASAHMGTIAGPVAGAIATKFPDRISGTASGEAADLVTSLNTALREHVFLTSATTRAALASRTAEYDAAAKSRDTNSETITAVIASTLGTPAGDAFRPLWKKHIVFVVDYTAGLATKNTAKKDKAVSDLLAYTQEFGAFLNSPLPSLPTETMADAVKQYIISLKEVIDAQAARDWTKAYVSERIAAGHMKEIANPLAAAIVKQFPDRFKT